ncbi:MAG: TetR/AcrR family transcriptional regulator [Rhizomicrobium sp.]
MTRTRPAEVRKEQLLKAARAVLAKKGFAQMRVSDIVEKAGMSQGSFYLHFASKEAVIAELFRSMINDALAMIEATHSPEQDMETALRNTVMSYYKVCFQYRDVLESTDGGAAHGMDRQAWNEMYRPTNEFALNLVRTWQKRGDVSPDADPNVVSWLIIDSVNGAMGRLFGHSGNRVSKDYEAYVVGWILAALRSFQGPSKKSRS